LLEHKLKREEIPVRTHDVRDEYKKSHNAWGPRSLDVPPTSTATPRCWIRSLTNQGPDTGIPTDGVNRPPEVKGQATVVMIMSALASAKAEHRNEIAVNWVKRR